MSLCQPTEITPVFNNFGSCWAEAQDLFRFQIRLPILSYLDLQTFFTPACHLTDRNSVQKHMLFPWARLTRKYWNNFPIDEGKTLPLKNRLGKNLSEQLVLFWKWGGMEWLWCPHLPYWQSDYIFSSIFFIFLFQQCHNLCHWQSSQ